MNGLRERFMREFQNKEYRHAYVDDFLNASIATQIKVLREQKNWTQIVLAQRAEMKQSRISALENVNYESWSIKTLRKLAKAFDVALVVKFVSFGDRLLDIECFSREALQVPSFEDDPVFHQAGPSASSVGIAPMSIDIQQPSAEEPDKKLQLLLGEFSEQLRTVPLFVMRGQPEPSSASPLEVFSRP